MQMPKLLPSCCLLMALLVLTSVKTMVPMVKGENCAEFLGGCSGNDCTQKCISLHPRPEEKAGGACREGGCVCGFQCGGSVSKTCKRIFGRFPCGECQSRCHTTYNGQASCIPAPGSNNPVCQCQFDC